MANNKTIDCTFCDKKTPVKIKKKLLKKMSPSEIKLFTNTISVFKLEDLVFKQEFYFKKLNLFKTTQLVFIINFQ